MGPRWQPRWGSHGHCWSLLKWYIRSHPGPWEWLSSTAHIPRIQRVHAGRTCPAVQFYNRPGTTEATGSMKWKYLLPYQQMRNVTAISTPWPPYVNEGSQNCDPADATMHHGLLRSWGNARSSHLPLLKVNKETGFGPRYLRCIWKEWSQWVQRLASSHTQKVKFLNLIFDLGCSDCLLPLL